MGRRGKGQQAKVFFLSWTNVQCPFLFDVTARHESRHKLRMCEHMSILSPSPFTSTLKAVTNATSSPTCAGDTPSSSCMLHTFSSYHCSKQSSSDQPCTCAGDTPSRSCRLHTFSLSLCSKQSTSDQPRTCAADTPSSSCTLCAFAAVLSGSWLSRLGALRTHKRMLASLTPSLEDSS